MRFRCELKASSVEPPPVLDEATFQQILTAAYVLQLQNELRTKNQACSHKVFSEPVAESVRPSVEIGETDDILRMWELETIQRTESEWTHALAAERALMAQVLERIKPQLERLAACRQASDKAC